MATGCPCLESSCLRLPRMTDNSTQSTARHAELSDCARRSQAGLPAAISDLGAPRAHPLGVVGRLRPAARRARARRPSRRSLEDSASSTASRSPRAPIDDRAQLGQPAVLATRAATQRQADHPALRPPRRAAARQRRRLGVGALRADRARRPAVRPRRRRRQGRRHGARRGDPRLRRGRRAPTSTSASSSSSRARRSSARAPSPTSSPRTASSSRADVIVVADSRQLGHRHARAHRRAARQRHIQADGVDARARLALRDVRGSGARRDARRDPSARDAARADGRSRSRPRPRATARHPEYAEERLRRGGRPSSTGSRRSGTAPILSRLWYQPAITITGIDAPTVHQRIQHPRSRR